MTWALLVELVKALAWPLVVAFAIVTVRGFKIGPIFNRLKSGKIGPVEVSFLEPKEVPLLPAGTTPASVVVEATGTAAGTSTMKVVGTSTTDEPPTPPPSTPPSLPPPPAPVPDPGPAAEPALVEFAPAGAIVNAWARFEEVVRREGTRLGVPRAERAGGVMHVVNGLVMFGVIAADLAVVAQSLFKVRNEVAHPGKDGVRVPTSEAAQRYVETVDGLIDRLELNTDVIRLKQLREQLGNPPPGIVRVGQLRGGGVGANPDAARRMADARRGMWAARAFGTIMAISDRDASVLISDGATLVRDIENDNDDDPVHVD